MSGSSGAAGGISPASLAPGSADPTSLGEEGMISLWRNFLCERHWKTLWEEMGAQCLAGSGELCETGLEHPSTGHRGPGFGGVTTTGGAIATQ